MDWTALLLSFRLASLTVLALLPVGLLLGRWMAFHDPPGKSVIEALILLPLVLPPTVFGFYLLVAFGATSPLGRAWQAIAGQPCLEAISLNLSAIKSRAASQEIRSNFPSPRSPTRRMGYCRRSR